MEIYLAVLGEIGSLRSGDLASQRNKGLQKGQKQPSTPLRLTIEIFSVMSRLGLCLHRPETQSRVVCGAVMFENRKAKLK